MTKPLPLHIMIDALQDKIHTEVKRKRKIAKIKRIKKDN